MDIFSFHRIQNKNKQIIKNSQAEYEECWKFNKKKGKTKTLVVAI